MRQGYVCFTTEPGCQECARLQLREESSRGQSLIEFALILPLILLLVVNVVNFGAFIYAWITLDSSKLTITLGYPNGSDNPGNRVKVTVQYTYDPFVGWLQQLQVPLSSTSEGVIAF